MALKILPECSTPKQPGLPPKWDCKSCLKSTSVETRRSLHCGWMPRSHWAGTRAEVPPALIEGERVEYDVCPGWLVRQPLVAEIAEAWAAFSAGNFDAFYPNPSNIVCEGVLQLERAMNAHQRETLRREREAATLSRLSTV